MITFMNEVMSFDCSNGLKENRTMVKKKLFLIATKHGSIANNHGYNTVVQQ